MSKQKPTRNELRIARQRAQRNPPPYVKGMAKVRRCYAVVQHLAREEQMMKGRRLLFGHLPPPPPRNPDGSYPLDLRPPPDAEEKEE